jgi:uncharacterized protein with ParB-like and HNH nuclease domain
VKIESRDQSVGALLNSGYYVIPRFQRPYSWDDENISEFWADTIVNATSEYFIGSMVMYTIGDRRFGVVDGQQRLTTIVILLSALRNALEKAGLKNQASGLHKLIERENIDNKTEYVLQTESSYPYFQTHVLSREPAEIEAKIHDEEERIRRAYGFFTSAIDDLFSAINADPGLSEKKKKESIKTRLVGIRDALLSLKLIAVTLDSQDDAYVIFETLNTRGKDLALADLVKNHFTKLLKPKNVGLDQPRIKWTKIRETIEGSKSDIDTDTFIYHYWLSRHDYVASKKIFKEFRKYVNSKNANEVLSALVLDAEYYRVISEHEYWKWPKEASDAKASLAALNLFRVKQQIPCALSMMRAYKEKKINISQLISALSNIEKFHFLFTAITSQRSSGGISGMYASLARQISNVKNAQEATPVLRELKAKLKERVPSEAEFLALFPELLYTNTTSKQCALVKYVLAKIGRSEEHQYAVDIDELTIEHLYPQSKIDGRQWTENVVGQTGNMILVTKAVNDKLNNRSFKEKKEILRANKCINLIPDYFQRAEELTPELISKRTESLAKTAYNSVWRI